MWLKKADLQFGIKFLVPSQHFIKKLPFLRGDENFMPISIGVIRKEKQILFSNSIEFNKISEISFA